MLFLSQIDEIISPSTWNALPLALLIGHFYSFIKSPDQMVTFSRDFPELSIFTNNHIHPICFRALHIWNHVYTFVYLYLPITTSFKTPSVSFIFLFSLRAAVLKLLRLRDFTLFCILSTPTQRMKDLSALTRDWTCALSSESTES